MHIEIDNEWENFFSFYGSNSGLCGKPFPLLILSVFTNFYLKIYNLLRKLLVSGIILEQVYVGIKLAFFSIYKYF
jgi:hypothetical protein